MKTRPIPPSLAAKATDKKYQAKTDRIAALEQALQESEARCRALEQSLLETRNELDQAAQRHALLETQCQALEQHLQQAASSRQRLLDSIADGFIIYDSAFRCTYINPASERLFGIQLANLSDRSVWETCDPQACPNYYAGCQKAMRERVPITVEQFYAPMNAWYESYIFPIEEGIAVYFRDITERKRMEAQLAQSQRLESLGMLAGGLAHDFNNLLTAIVGCTELAEEELPEAHPAHAHLKHVLETSERAARLIRQLFSFARQQKTCPQLCDLNALVRNMRAMLQVILGERRELVLELSPHPVPVSADLCQLEQVLLNLTVNARDAMPQGGRLTLATDTLPEKSPDQEPDGMSRGPVACLRVIDTGIGMSEEVQARIFDPFFTTKDPEKGTGLGLAVCFGILRQHGGTIEVQSAPGQGTTFDIRLPLCPETQDDGETLTCAR